MRTPLPRIKSILAAYPFVTVLCTWVLIMAVAYAFMSLHHMFQVEKARKTGLEAVLGQTIRGVSLDNRSRVPDPEIRSLFLLRAGDTYDPRAVQGIGVTYATSTMGADHTAGYAIATNILKVGGFVDPLKNDGQVELSRNLQIATAAIDSTGLCLFIAFPALDIPETLAAIIDMINAKYGIALTGDDVTGLGKTVLKIERAFNTAAGFTKEDDRLPEFFETDQCPPHNLTWTMKDEELDEFWNF